jgi:hypothetical protein
MFQNISLALAPAPAAHSVRLFRVSADRRVHPRVAFAVGGRIMLESHIEFGATTIEGSVRSLALRTEAKPRIGERIIGYFDAVGRIEGKVDRLLDDGIAVDLINTVRKRDKLAAQLTWLANREMLNLPEDRRHDRVVPRDPRVQVRLVMQSEAEAVSGALIDVSHGGAAVSVQGKFARGDEVMLGTTPARVVRAFEGGFAAEFKAPIPEVMFDVAIRL